MATMPGTRASLLVRLRDAKDEDAWSQFVGVYAPLIHGLARRRGLQDADAADLTQEVLRSVMTSIARLDYDPARGSFRGWLFTIARRRLHDHLQAKKGVAIDAAPLDQIAAPDEEARRWEMGYREQLLELAAAEVRGEFAAGTWQAFWLLAVEGKSGAAAAEATGLTPGAAYVAKSRVLARLRQKVAELEESC